MRKITLAVSALMAALVAGCSSGDSLNRVEAEKNFGLVEISPTSDYRVVERAEGTSSGFWLLFIPIYMPSTATAEEDLFTHIDVPVQGHYTIANVVSDTSWFTVLLFTVPTRHVRADVVEFVSKGSPSPASGSSTPSPPTVAAPGLPTPLQPTSPTQGHGG